MACHLFMEPGYGHEEKCRLDQKKRAMQVAAPERMGENTLMWIIRPAIRVGRTEISLSEN